MSDFLGKHDEEPKVIYVVHGWKEGKDSSWIYDMSKAIGKRYNKNNHVVTGLVLWNQSHQYDPAKETIRESWAIQKFICCSPVGPSVRYGPAAANTWPVGNILGYIHESILTTVN